MHVRRGLFAFVVLMALIVGQLPAAQAAAPDEASAAVGTPSPGAAVDAAISSAGDRDMPAVAAASVEAASRGTAATIPVLGGVSADAYAARKLAAATSTSAAQAVAVNGAAPAGSTASEFTPQASPQFEGLNDGQNATFNGFTLQPSDQALAASGTFVLQAVNDLVAVYNTSGTLQAGFPKTLANFFGVPTCGTTGIRPFMTDPRAFFDTGDGRFWVLADEVEGNGLGVNDCPNISRIWVAVSASGNPTGTWHIFNFNRQNADGANDWADYPTFGYDDNGVYFGTNQFTAGGASFVGSEYGGCGKKKMESGAAPFCSFFINPSFGALLDTMQPVQNPGNKTYGWPQTEFFVSSENINFGGGQCSGGCSAIVVWSFHFSGTTSANVSGVALTVPTYSLAPGADDPGHCTGCIETIDTRVTATPTYRNGHIWAALETAVNNGTQVVPGIDWLLIRPVVDDPPNVPMDGATFIDETGIYNYTGDGAAFFGAIMPDAEGNAFMVFNFSGNGFNPEAAYVSRRAVNQKNLWQDLGLCLISCVSGRPTGDTRWGDYSATSYDGTANHVWIATQYSNGDWGTRIGKLQYTTTQP